MFPADVWIIISNLLESESERRPLRQTCTFLRAIIPYSESRGQEVVNMCIMKFIQCSKVIIPITMTLRTASNELFFVRVDADNRITNTDAYEGPGTTKRYKKVSVWKGKATHYHRPLFWDEPDHKYPERYEVPTLCGPVFRYEGDFPRNKKFSDLLYKQKRAYINRIINTYEEMTVVTDDHFIHDIFNAHHEWLPFRDLDPATERI